MKKKPSAKLQLGKVKVAMLNKNSQEQLKGGQQRRCTDVETCPTWETFRRAL